MAKTRGKLTTHERTPAGGSTSRRAQRSVDDSAERAGASADAKAPKTARGAKSRVNEGARDKAKAARKRTARARVALRATPPSEPATVVRRVEGARTGSEVPAGPYDSTLAAPEGGKSRRMELHWDDDAAPPPTARRERLVDRWVKRGDALLRQLAEHGVSRHEYRADLREGRFVWLSPEGWVSAEAEARVICCYTPSTSTLSMAWADPFVRCASVARIHGVPKERDGVDEEDAWRAAMEAADRMEAEYLYRVSTPQVWYFLALCKLSFSPERSIFTPSTPVGMVLKSLFETRSSIESRAESAEVVRHRLLGVGRTLLHEAEYAYRGTDWVARLARTGQHVLKLASRVPRASFSSVAAGQCPDEWLDRETTLELSEGLVLLEDEWALFS